jgi:hypothetical protein
VSPHSPDLPDRRLLPPPKRSRFGFAQAGPADIMPAV